MNLIPVYRPRPSPLHAARAGVGALFCCALALTAALYRHPLVLAATLGAVVVAGLLAGVGREIKRSVVLSLPLAILVTIVNPLLYAEGNTLLVRGGEFLGRRIDITLEATLFGAMTGLRLMALVAALGLLSAAVDPDELLRVFRRVSYRSALTASLANRLVPVLARDAMRMGDAARCRPQPAGRFAVVRAALTGALDRSVDVAAALEVRGYALGGRPPRRARPWSRHDLAFLTVAVAIAALAIAGAITGIAWVEPYPTFAIAWDGQVWALAGAIVALALAPFIGRRARLGVGGGS
jgi:energy-coupling factor transport system permease protein